MRIVTTPDFCKVCLEGLWHHLLNRVDLIDDLDVGCDGQTRTVNLTLVPLAQYRTDAVESEESYAVTWYKDGRVLGLHANSTLLELDDFEALGHYTVDVQFTTEEVRLDTRGLLRSRANFTIDERCSH